MDDREPLVLPKQFATAMRKFLTNGCTGNLKLNVKDGRILGLHVEEIISFKAVGEATTGPRHRPSARMSMPRPRNRNRRW